MKMKRYKLLVLAVISGLMFGCSNSGSCSTCNNGSSSNQGSNGDVTSIKVTSPYLIPSLSNESSFGFVLVRNETESAVKNIQYGITNPIGGGANVIIDSISAQQCSKLLAAASCKLKLAVPAGSAGGAFNLSLSNNSTTTNKQASAATTASSQLIGVQPTQYTSLSGANGVVGYYYPVVLNGVQYLVFVGTVTSSAVGPFNSVQLVTGSSNQPLPNVSNLSDNLGAGMPTLGKGSSFSLLVPVQTSVATQNFKIQLSTVATNGNASNVQTGTASYSLTTVANQGIAVLYPAALNLSSSSPSQQFVMSNIGDVQLSNVSVSGSGVTVSGLNSTIPPASNSGAVITLTGTQAPNSITVSVNNGNSEQNQTVPVNNNPTPSPTPTPTPSPGPAPTPTADLRLALTPNNNFVNTSAGLTNATRVLTLTNSGTSTENGIVLHLPSGFIGTSATGQSVTPCTITTGSGSATLSLGTDLTTSSTSCDVLVSYTPHTVVSSTPATITVDYNYNNGQAAPQASVGVNYQVTLSTAILAWSPNNNPVVFNPIYNNMVDTSSIQFTVNNTGEADATNVTIDNGGSNYFNFNPATTTGAACTTTGATFTIAGNSSCNTMVDFGPATATASTKTAVLTASYTYAGNTGGTQTTVANLQGQINPALSAAINGTTGLTGTGVSGDSYSLATGASGTITVRYSNLSSNQIAGFTTTANALPTGWMQSTHGCSNVTLVATSGSCDDVYTLNNATAASGDYNMLTNVTAIWTGNASATQISGSPDVYYAFIASPTPAANITLNTIIPAGFVNNSTSGAGTSATPFVLNYNANVGHTTSSTITLTYSNSGGDASNFTTTMATLPPGWTLTTHGCNGASLSTNGTASCNDIYTFSSNAPLSALTSTSDTDHPTNFDTAVISSSWTDSGGAHSTSLPAITGIGYNTNGVINTTYFLNIFVSATTHDANFSTPTDITGSTNGKPIGNADIVCANDANKPNDGYTYKALFAYGSDINNVAPGEKRFACGGTPSTNYCGTGATAGYDWVMESGYVQYRSLANNTLNIVGTTDAIYGIVTAYSQGFGNTLDHYSQAWTGLSSSYTNQWMSPESMAGGSASNAGLTCAGWTDGTSASNRGRAGTTAGSSGSLHYYSYSSGSDTWADKTTSVGYGGLYSTNNMYCYMAYHLYCVQQVQ